MRILLMKPPVRGCMFEIGRHLPIGLAYLAAVLEASGHDVTVFDGLAYAEDNHVVAPSDLTPADRAKLAAHPRWGSIVHWGASWPRIEAALVDTQPEVVGISCMFTPFYETSYEAAALAKRVVPDARVVLGGQHPTVAAGHALRSPDVDVLVLGEGERTAVELLAALEAGDSLTGLDGVAYRCGEGWCDCAVRRLDDHVAPSSAWIDDLDALPRPRVDGLDFGRYGDAATLITSRGCPFACSFCTVHATVGRAFRSRSPEGVVDEMQWYVDEHGIRRFLIEDDNFTYDPARVRAICAEIMRRELDVEIGLPNGITVVRLDDGLIADMVGAGFRSLFLGLETTDPERLRAIKKGFASLGKVRSRAARFDELGADVGASVIVGLPGQRVGEIARDACNLVEAGVRFWTNPFYPIPGSPDYEKCVAAGTITTDTELALFDQFNFAIGSDVLTPAELYWCWVHTQAIAQWPHLARAAWWESGPPAGLGAAAEALVAGSVRLAAAIDRLEVPALPVAAVETPVGVRLDVHPDGCFCAWQQVRERRSGGGPDDFCAFSGDVLAAALSVLLDQPLGARQVASRVATGAPFCAFEVRSVAVHPVVEEFLAELRAAHSPAGGRAPALAASVGAGFGRPLP